MFHTAQSNNGHSARTSGSVCCQQYRAKTICLSPLPWDRLSAPPVSSDPNTLASIGTRRIPQMSDLCTSENATF
jgi:hypothetical protein